MFVITPGFFYSGIYFVIRKLLDCIGMQPVIVKIDEKIIRAVKKI
jgi:hypothetical protein